jgi:hypothetical protein
MLGVLLLVGIRVRLVCLAMIGLSLGYIAVLSFVLPQMWLDPLASVLKVLPIIMLAGFIAIMDNDR